MKRQGAALIMLAALAVGIAFIPVPSLIVIPAAAAQATPTEPDKHAVLVAINNYANTGFTSLNYAVSDIEKLEAVLKKSSFKVTVLTNKNATKKAIENAVRTVSNNRKEGGLLLLAMSGHGVQFLNSSGKEDAYFCPADVDKDKDETMVSLTSTVTALGNRGPNLVLIDACRDDPKKGVTGNELRGVLQAKTAVLLSCSAGQSSFETNQMYKDQPDFNPKTTEGHGVFFYHVLRALEGEAKDEKGRVTWGRMVEYVGSCNVNAKKWLPQDARRTASRQSASVEDASLQEPQEIRNLPTSVNPVLASVKQTSRVEEKLEKDLVQVKFTSPAGMRITWLKPEGGYIDESEGRTVPTTARSFAAGKVHKLRLTQILPNYPGRSFYPSLEILGHDKTTAEFLKHGVIEIALTDDDFQDAIANKLVMIGIAMPESGKKDENTSFRFKKLITTEDAKAEVAKMNLTLLAILRLGSIDLEARDKDDKE